MRRVLNKGHGESRTWAMDDEGIKCEHHGWIRLVRGKKNEHANWSSFTPPSAVKKTVSTCPFQILSPFKIQAQYLAHFPFTCHLKAQESSSSNSS